MSDQNTNTYGKLSACPNKPNCINSFSKSERHRMAPFKIKKSATTPASNQEVFDALESILQSMPRTEIVKREPAYLHATNKSAIFKFTDDLEFQLSDDGETLHFRSAARLGYYDLGVNRSRMEEIKSKLQEKGIIENS